MAEETTTQAPQSGLDVDSITPELMQQFLDTGEPVDFPVEEETETQETEMFAEKPQEPSPDAKAALASVAQLAELMKVIQVQNAQNAQNGKPQPNIPQEKATSQEIKELLLDRGFAEDTAKLLSDTIAQAAEKTADKKVSVMKTEIDGLKQNLQGLTANQQMKELINTTEKNLMAKGITDPQDIADIRDLAMARVMQKPNARLEDYFREVESSASRVIDRNLKITQTKTEKRVEEDKKLPPPGGKGKIGQLDVVKHILKNDKDPKNRPRGQTWQKMLVNMIQGGSA